MHGVGIDVRRLAAVDMHGTKGTRTRARVILAEFVFGAVAGPAFALVTIMAAPGVAWKLFGVALLGIGLNYIPMARYALLFRDSEVLRAELEGVDVRQELRRYTVAQVWVLVPFAFLVFDRRQRAPEPAD